MKNKYLVLNTKDNVFIFLISAILFIGCGQNQSARKFSKKKDPTETKTTPPAAVSIAPAVTEIKYLLLPGGTAQTYNNKSNLIIENLSFGNQNASFQNGNILVLVDCSNITIRNCYFGSSAGVGIYAFESKNIKIENCLFAYNKTSVYFSRSSGAHVKSCQFINTYGSGDARGEFVKFVECTGEGNGVENCRGENFAGESNPEDLISIYKSSGASTSPINITGNIFRGGGPSASGGGIVAGDGDNTTTGGYVSITNNTLVDPGQYGIAAAGGTNITITGNKIYARKQPWTNNPLFVWNQNSPACANIVVKNNRANWTDKNGDKNPGWNAGNCSNTVFEEPTTITLAEINIPSHLVNFITAAELLTVRQLK
jgi:hypothetical protein